MSRIAPINRADHKPDARRRGPRGGRKWSLAATALSGVLAVASAAMGQSATEAPAADPDGNLALSERFAMLGKQLLIATRHTPPLLHAVEELYRAAGRLNTGELRFPQTRYDAAMAAGDTDGAIDAIKAYRNIEPADETAQIAQISLYLTRMEVVDQQLSYIEQLLARPQIPASVRSWASLRAAGMYAERHEAAKMLHALDEAIRLNPLNYDAQFEKFRLQEKSLSPADQVSGLLAMIRCNPANPNVAGAIAGEAADAALAGQSIEWYTFANHLYNERFWGPTPAEFVRGFASELYINGQTVQSLELLKQYQAARPGDTAAWLIRLAIEKELDVNGSYENVLQQAQIAFANQLAEISKAIGNDAATTQPFDSGKSAPLPDIDADINRIQAISDPDRQNRCRRAYLGTLYETGWFYTYFERDAAAGAKFAAAIARLDPAGDGNQATVVLQGWVYFINGQLDAARTKLSALEDHDPNAALGMIELNINNDLLKDATTARARRLMSEHPSGPVGTQLFAALNPIAGSLPPEGNSEVIKAEIDAFPRGMLDVAETPNNYYSVQVKPLKAAYKVGEPMLAQVMIQNISDYDLTIGPDGVIKPQIWFDAQAHGLEDQSVQRAGVDEIGVAVPQNEPQVLRVLRSHHATGNIMRLDDGPLLANLQANPLASMQVMFSVTTNPAEKKTGGADPGPGGYTTDTLEPFDVEGQSLGTSTGRAGFYDQMATGGAAAKITGIDALQAYIRMLTRTPADKITDDVRSSLGEVGQRLQLLATDAAPSVRAWASFVVASLSSPDGKTAFVRRMCADPQWPVRMLGVLTAESLPDGDTWVSAVAAGDADANVKALAQARLDQEQFEKDNPPPQPSSDVSSVGTGPAVTPTDSPPSDATPKPETPQAPADSSSAGSAPKLEGSPPPTDSAPKLQTPPAQ